MLHRSAHHSCPRAKRSGNLAMKNLRTISDYLAVCALLACWVISIGVSFLAPALFYPMIIGNGSDGESALALSEKFEKLFP